MVFKHHGAGSLDSLFFNIFIFSKSIIFDDPTLACHFGGRVLLSSKNTDQISSKRGLNIIYWTTITKFNLVKSKANDSIFKIELPPRAVVYDKRIGVSFTAIEDAQLRKLYEVAISENETNDEINRLQMSLPRQIRASKELIAKFLTAVSIGTKEVLRKETLIKLKGRACDC